MADIANRIEYYYAIIPNRTGEGNKIFNVLKSENVNLIAFSGFPAGWGRAQIDFVPQLADREKFVSTAQKAGIKLIGPKVGFLVQGEDRIGAAAEILSRLAQEGINITAMQAIASGEGRYGAIVWVKSGDISRAEKALGIS